jgi:hypothetical protein
MSKEQKTKQIIKNLQSDDSSLIKNTIKELRDSGNSGYIPFLIELLHSTDNSEIKQLIIKLLNDLKHSDAIPKIIEAIQNGKYSDERQSLVSVCWENGLDFSQYLSLFVDLVIEEEFSVAFEAFTVIENMNSNIDDSVKEEQVQKIKNNLDGAHEEKAYLLNNLIEIIPHIKEREEGDSIMN